MMVFMVAKPRRGDLSCPIERLEYVFSMMLPMARPSLTRLISRLGLLLQFASGATSHKSQACQMLAKVSFGQHRRQL
jgi:hypothetical protein